MASPPAAAPHKKTKTSVTAQASLGSHDLPAATLSRRLILIGCQRDQHVVLSGSGIKRGRILLRHHGFRRKAGGIPGLARYQVASQNPQGEQGRKRQAAAEGEIQREETGKR